jgi:hypothetical protein
MLPSEVSVYESVQVSSPGGNTVPTASQLTLSVDVTILILELHIGQSTVSETRG